MRRALTVAVLLLLWAAGCQPGTPSTPAPTVTRTTTATETHTVTATETITPTPTGTPREELGQQEFGTRWSVEVSQRGDMWCMTARVDDDSQEICGDAVALDEVHGGREVVSAVEFQVAGLDITAGLVAETVARVRVETAPPPENPDGPGTFEEVEPVDALVGFNAYAEADRDPTPDEADLPTVRVVAFDATGDELGTAEPTSAST